MPTVIHGWEVSRHFFLFQCQRGPWLVYRPWRHRHCVDSYAILGIQLARLETVHIPFHPSCTSPVCMPVNNQRSDIPVCYQYSPSGHPAHYSMCKDHARFSSLASHVVSLHEQPMLCSLQQPSPVADTSPASDLCRPCSAVHIKSIGCHVTHEAQLPLFPWQREYCCMSLYLTIAIGH